MIHEYVGTLEHKRVLIAIVDPKKIYFHSQLCVTVRFPTVYLVLGIQSHKEKD